jgi:hypothetical protein
MTVFSSSGSIEPASDMTSSQHQLTALLRGEILLQTRSHSAWGGAVTAQIYLPMERSLVWQKVTDYPCWVQYFPDLIHSEVLQPNPETSLKPASLGCKRLHQVATKAFLFLSVQVEIYLNVFEVVQQQIKFQLEKGSFHDFTADLKLQDAGTGTLLTYAVQATPTIPVPSLLIEQAIKLDLPSNLKKMRQVICGS